jgi:Putative DNA-binding domain
MKRLFFLILVIWRQQLKVYLIAALIGSAIGVLVLAPSYDYINTREQADSRFSSIGYVFSQIRGLLQGENTDYDTGLLIFYAEIGAMLGLLSIILYNLIHKRLLNIDYLKSELNNDLPSIIQQGESSRLEFKSSLRWDIAESRINRVLESVILKTLAGFLNSSVGGTLLIGVADNGDIIGLEKDYLTLKKLGQDGFEQSLMTAISNNLGADLCVFVHVLFHAIDSKDVCRVIVSPASRPVFLEQGNTPKFYVRTGGGTRDLNIQEALGFVAGRWKHLK